MCVIYLQTSVNQWAGWHGGGDQNMEILKFGAGDRMKRSPNYGYLICSQMLDRIKVNSRGWATCGCKHGHELRQWGCAYAQEQSTVLISQYSQPCFWSVFVCVLGRGKGGGCLWQSGWGGDGKTVLWAQHCSVVTLPTSRMWKHGSDSGSWWLVIHDV